MNSIFNALFPQVAQAEETAQNVGAIAAAWGLVIALELALIIWLLGRR